MGGDGRGWGAQVPTGTLHSGPAAGSGKRQCWDPGAKPPGLWRGSRGHWPCMWRGPRGHGPHVRLCSQASQASWDRDIAHTYSHVHMCVSHTQLVHTPAPAARLPAVAHAILSAWNLSSPSLQGQVLRASSVHSPTHQVTTVFLHMSALLPLQHLGPGPLTLHTFSTY